jgi:quercetin dioxygenase-like cupin family protein
MDFFRADDLPPTEVLPGVLLRSVSLESLTMTFVEYRAGSTVPSHHHQYDQITYVLEGFLEIQLGDARRVLGPGEGVRIPAKTAHGSRAVEGAAKAIDAWSPSPESLRLEDLAVLAVPARSSGETPK